MSSRKICIIFILILIIGVNLAEAGPVKIWDTKVLEKNPDGTGRQFYSFTSSLSWANKENWVQVPYGTTRYAFKGETVIENGNYWIIFHSTGFDSPFIYPNLRGTPGIVGELYGKANVDGNEKFNLYKKSVTIITNTANEVSVMVDAGYIKGENQIKYTILKDANWFKEEPYNNYQYDFAIHSSPNRFAVAVQDDGAGDDFVVDPQKGIRLDKGQHKRFYPESYRNNMILQQINAGKKDNAYMLISPDPDAADMYIDVYKANDNSMRLGSIRGNANKDGTNYAMYAGILNYDNVFRYEEVNMPIVSGATYYSSFEPAIPGRWRMSARVNGVYYTRDVNDGNFKFKSPVSGNLEVLTMYLYDRTGGTPADVNTPMDIYRDIKGESVPSVISTVSTPAFSHPADTYSNAQIVSDSTATNNNNNYINNPLFESGMTSWKFYTNGIGTFSTVPQSIEEDNFAMLSLDSIATNIQLYQEVMDLEPDTSYRLSFAAYSTTGHDMIVNLIRHDAPYTNYGLSYTADLGTDWKKFTFEFTTSSFTQAKDDGRLMFWLSPFARAGDNYYIDNVILQKIQS